MNYKFIRTRSTFHGSSSATDKSTSASPDLSETPGAASGDQAAPTVLDAPGVPLMELEDVYSRQSYNRKESGFGLVNRLMRLVSRQVFPQKLTPEEIALLDEQKKRELQEKKMSEDAIADMRNITACLTNLGLCAWSTEEGRKRVTQRVKFDQPWAEPDAVHLHVNRRLPWGVTVAELTDPATLDNLSHSCGHTVRCRYTPETGIWYTVERASGRGGIPNHVTYTDLFKRLPASAGPLAIPVGITGNARPIFEDLGRMPHLLVGGTTGGGKSNFLHAIICTLIQRNSPQRLRLLLVDLKGGMEFGRYEGTPHLMVDPTFNPTGIVEHRDHVAPFLDFVISEGERRIALMRSTKSKDVGHYNAHRKERLSSIVIVIDEWADMLMIDKKEAEAKLVNIVSRMRSVGIHVILATQNPTSEVITGKIKVNLPCRVAFSVPNIHGSMAIINNGAAVGLQPAGRCILQFRQEIEVQTPYLPIEAVDAYIKAQVTGKVEEVINTSDVTPREVMEWALQYNNGWLSQRKTWAQFKDRISLHDLIDMMASWDGKEFVIESSAYKCVMMNTPKGPPTRRLVAVLETAAPAPAPAGHDPAEKIGA